MYIKVGTKFRITETGKQKVVTVISREDAVKRQGEMWVRQMDGPMGHGYIWVVDDYKNQTRAIHAAWLNQYGHIMPGDET